METRHKAVLFVIAVLMTVPFTAFAQVRDDAGMFSAGAVQEANQKIDNLRARSGKTLVVQTIASLGRSDVRSEARKRFANDRINGVLIFITKQEHKLDVVAGQQTQKVFGQSKLDEVASTMRSRFKASDFDGGLREAVSFTEGVLVGAASVPSSRTGGVTRRVTRTYTPYRAAPRSGGLGIIGLVLIIFGVVIVVMLIRGIFSGYGAAGGMPGGMGYGGGYGGGWGGGLFSGLLGGMAGAWIGNSMYNMFSGGQRDSGYVETTTYEDSSSSTSSDWQRDDSGAVGSDSSSDWGDSGGGGDIGGGDSGGGGSEW